MLEGPSIRKGHEFSLPLLPSVSPLLRIRPVLAATVVGVVGVMEEKTIGVA